MRDIGRFLEEQARRTRIAGLPGLVDKVTSLVGSSPEGQALTYQGVYDNLLASFIAVARSEDYNAEAVIGHKWRNPMIDLSPRIPGESLPGMTNSVSDLIATAWNQQGVLRRIIWRYALPIQTGEDHSLPPTHTPIIDIYVADKKYKNPRDDDKKVLDVVGRKLLAPRMTIPIIPPIQYTIPTLDLDHIEDGDNKPINTQEKVPLEVIQDLTSILDAFLALKKELEGYHPETTLDRVRKAVGAEARARRLPLINVNGFNE